MDLYPTSRSGPPRARERFHRALLEIVRSSVLDGDRVVLLLGEAGIGKTHLARSVADTAAAEQVTVAWGRADPMERAVPYAAIGQVLQSLPGGSDVLTSARSGLRADPVRNQVLQPVVDLLAAHCARGPLVVVIDDLHYADEDTLVLLGLLVRRLTGAPITWIVVSRPNLAEPVPALGGLLHRLREDRRLVEMTLEGLDAVQLAGVVEETVGRQLPDETLDAIVERAAGNPFFAVQLTLSLAEQGALDTAAGRSGHRVSLSLPRRAVILERVFPLGENARAMARALCVVGAVETAELVDLGAALGMDNGDVVAGFDRLVRANLLHETGAGRYEFVHDLVRETLYGELGPAERRRLHAAAARSLLGRKRRGHEVDAVALAHHLSLGLPGPDPAAVDALRDAGDALVPTSPRSAAVRYRQALSYLDPTEPAAGELLSRLARALLRANEPAEVVRLCRQGLAHATGDDRDRLTRYLSAALIESGEAGAAREMIGREILHRGDTAILLTTRALLHRMLGDHDAAEEDIIRAERAARSPEDRLTVLFQRINLGVDVGARAGAGAALRQLESMVPSLDRQTRLMAHVHAAGAFAGRGEIARGIGHLESAARLTAEGVTDVDWPWTFAATVALETAAARWDAAQLAYDRGSAELSGGLRLLSRNHAITPASDIAFARRDRERLTRYRGEVDERTVPGGWVQALVANKVHRTDGDAASAVAVLEEAVGLVPPRSQMAAYLLLGLTLTQHQFGDRSAALASRERLEQVAAAIGTVWADTVVDLVAVAVADDVEAGRAGLARCIEHGNRRYEPEFQLHLGRLGVDPSSNLTAAHRHFVERRAAGLLEATEAAMRRHGQRVPSRRQRDRFALTDAERKVAELVAQGHSNRRIAETLSYSVKTVETYLSRVYTKTGCINRVELTRRLVVEKSGN